MSASEAATGSGEAPGNLPSRAAARVGRRIVALSAILIAFLTLLPEPPDPSSATPISPLCIICGNFGAVDVFLNVLLFLPLGLGLRLAGLSRRRAQLLVVVVTVAIELLQLTIIPGRDATISDVVNNSLGGWIGILIADSWRPIVFPAPRACRVLRVLGGAGWLGLWLVTARLAALSLPAAAWYGLVPPVNVYDEDFPGTVLSGILNGVPLPNAKLDDSKDLRDRTAVEGVRLEAIAVIGKPTRFAASMVSVVDDERNEIVMIGQERTDLIFRVRSRVQDFRLRPTTVRIPGILSAGDTVRLFAGFKDARFSLLAVSGHARYERVVPVSASWGWSLFLPFDYAMGPEGRWLTALWIAGLLVPLAYWAGRESPRPVRALRFPVAIVVAGLAVVPYVSGLEPVHWSEWTAAAVGLLPGFLAGRRSCRTTG